MSYRLGIDVGGTFTDLLLFNEETGELQLEKTPSTPADQSIGILEGIGKIVDAAGLAPEDLDLILHGTTVATNAVLEEKGATAWLEGEKIPKEKQKLLYQVDVRYYRQGFEFPITVQPDQFETDEGMEKFLKDFKDIHDKSYGFNIDSIIEIVNLRVTGIGRVKKVELPKFEKGDETAESAVTDTSEAWFDGEKLDTKIYDRNRLRPGHRVEGAAIILQKDSTTVILPEHHGTVDDYLNILIYPNDES